MILRLIIFFIWLPQATHQLLNWLYWIQVKEYRFDRFSVLLKSETGRKRLGVLGIWLKVLLLVLSNYTNTALYLLLFLLVVGDVGVVRGVWRKKLRKPVFTQRAKRIISTGVVFIFLTLLGLLFSNLAVSQVLIFGEMYLVLSLFIGVLWTIPIVGRIRKREVEKAQRKLSEVKPLVIGITGSYGKGTTKEFLYQLLSKKYRVQKTEGSENTEFGIARRAQKLKEDTEVFIVEMGAYKKGEIKRLCEIVEPNIGIVTGIEPQHIELFGSLENIKNAKYELIEALPNNGFGVFNLNSRGCVELFKRASNFSKELETIGCKVETKYLRKGRESGVYKASTPVAKVVKADVDGVSIQVNYEGKRNEIFALVKGIHFIENLLLAMVVARKLEVPWSKIEMVCKKLQSPPRTMQVYKLKKSIIIDDSFNSTPKGFKAALDYLNLFRKKKKVVITSGIIELGERSYAIHKNLGKLISKIADEVILTNRDFEEAILDGLGKESSKLEVYNARLMAKFNNLLKDNNVVLIEGRIPQNIINIISPTN